MPLTFSPFQRAIFSAITNTDQSLIIQAVAGSGKTTTIVEACKRIPENKSVLFLAFNKAIVDELKTRLPAGIHTRTFNSSGWGAWRRFTGKKFINIDANKNRKIAKNLMGWEEYKLYSSFVSRMVGLAKSMGLTPDSDFSQWSDLAYRHNVYPDSECARFDKGIEYAQMVLQASIDQADHNCDFDDQIYMPWLRDASFPKYDFVFIDEAQDTNGVQAQLLRRMLKKGGRLIAVGDRAQAIYGFRGADAAAMDNIQSTFNCLELPLSVTYRCAFEIVAEAQKWVPEIEAPDAAHSGEVRTLESYWIENFSGASEAASEAVLCRNNAPLIEIAYQFIARGKGVNFLGRDLGKGLVKLVDNMKARDLEDLEVKLENWLDRETEKLIKKDREDQAEILRDRVNCIHIFINNLSEDDRTVGDLKRAIEELFNQNNRGITLSSVHKSKGREWDNVYILDFDKYMPSKWAKRDWQKVQERNLIYVAITRAKFNLTYLSSNGWRN